MDDLGQVLRDLNGKAMSHRVYYQGHTWHLTKGSWDRREETLTGLLASIEEA